MSFKKNTTKFISTLLIILVIAPAVLFARPKEAHAQWLTHDIPNGIINIFHSIGITGGAVSGGANLGLHIKDIAVEVLKEFGRSIARRLLQEMTKSMVGWINSGFHGQPLFLTNPESFFKDIAKSEIKTTVDMFGYDSNKYPFGENFALSIINGYKRKLADNAAYSLNTLMTPTQAANYRNNFNAGGWNGFLINTQYPQNNYLGFQMLATEQLARNLQGTSQNAAQKVQTTLNQGLGFLSPQICSTNPNYNNSLNEFKAPQWNDSAYQTAHTYPEDNCGDDPTNSLGSTFSGNAVAWSAAVGAYNKCEAKYQDDVTLWHSNLLDDQAAFNDPNGKNVCPKKADGSSGLVNTTPGSVVGNQISKALGSSIDGTTLAATVGQSIAPIIDALLNHFTNEGLNALAGVINPPPAVDTWTYKGNTLTGTTTGLPPPADIGPGTCYATIAGGATVPTATTQTACGNANGLWVLTAASSTLPAGSPAGCYSTGIDGSQTLLTTITTIDNCTLVGGTWLGTKPSALIGCYSIDGTLPLTGSTTPDDCSTHGGSWNGPIPQPAAGYCSNTSDSSQLLPNLTTQIDCNRVGNTWNIGTPPQASTGTCTAPDGSIITDINGQAPTQGTCTDLKTNGIWTNNP